MAKIEISYKNGNIFDFIGYVIYSLVKNTIIDVFYNMHLIEV